MPIFETIKTRGVPIKVFANQLDEKARAQLIDLAESGIAEEFVAAMPDVHYGLGATIGSVFASSWAVCPNAVGVDIGCGMAAVPFPALKTNALSEETKWMIHKTIKERIPTGMMVHKSEQWAPVLDDRARTPWMNDQLKGRALRTLGTLGGGNHFIEIVHDPDGGVWAMLHSGSRNLGKITADFYNRLAKRHVEENKIETKNRDLNFLPIDSQEGRDYLLDMNWCQKFALANRQSMLEILGRVVGELTGAEADWENMVNIHHNFCSLETCGFYNSAGVWVEKELWITRKGATSARALQKGLIPGSMAVGSWLVEGLGNWESWYSCSHGAGRTKSRTASFAQISQESFEASMVGIVAETVPELRDEAPAAYKDLNGVMECQNDLVEPKVRLMPLINVKGWDRGSGGGKTSWTGPKVRVEFAGEKELGVQLTHVEAHLSVGEKKPVAQWIEVDRFVLRYTTKVVGGVREFWFLSPTHPGFKLFVQGTIEEADDEVIVVRLNEIVKTEKLKP